MSIRVFLNGQSIEAVEGQSVGAFLLQQNERITRTTRFNEKPRGMFCGIGVCFDCLITVDGLINQRACMTNIRDGMSIESQQGSGIVQ